MKVKNPGLFGFHFYKSATYYAFHDESIPNKRWFLIGLLLVKEQDLQDIRDFLKRIKEKNHCESEIHFSKLPKSFDGDYSSKAKVAREWMYLYQNTLKDYAMPTVLIVDKQSETFQSDRFAKDFHIYNRFTALALKCAISWHLRKENYDEVLIKFISDMKSRVSLPEKGIEDNFEKYIPSRAQFDSLFSTNPNYPKVNVQLETKDSSKEDLLQLIDLFLGSTQFALVGEHQRYTKKYLAQTILSWMRREDMSKKFDILLFPDKNGKMAKNIPFKLLLENDSHLFQ